MTTNCPICSSKRNNIFREIILNKYHVSYFYCSQCGLLQTEEPYWLDEAYNNPIADADTGLVARNIEISKKLAAIIFFLFDKNEKYLDVAGGYGMLTRLMRDIGFDFYWDDLYCENILGKGFDISTTSKPFFAITAFEVLEHIHNPIEFIQNSLQNAETSTIIFSTELFNGIPPKPQDWWYYSFESGQHISFYQTRTLQYIANKLSLYFYSYNNIHILTKNALRNTFLLPMTKNYILPFIYQYVKRNMKSKTLLDFKYISSKLQKEQMI